MVQEFQVLRCFSCHVFQVHQVKKSKKWVCKLCGEKQSLIKGAVTDSHCFPQGFHSFVLKPQAQVYGQGSAADCRYHVQKLNLLQGEVENTAISNSELNEVSENDDNTQSSGLSQPHTGAPISRWSKYVEEESENSCVKEEKDNELNYADKKCFYMQQNIASELRKRKENSQYACDFNEGMWNTIKKKRTCEEWTAPSKKPTNVPLSFTNEHVRCSEGHGTTVSPVKREPDCSGYTWERCISSEKVVEEKTSRRCSPQNNQANLHPVLNDVQHNGSIELSLWSAQTKTSFKSEFPRTVMSDEITSCASALCDDRVVDKPLCSIFQTDEDFDENY